jgi:hypothetical protein
MSESENINTDMSRDRQDYRERRERFAELMSILPVEPLEIDVDDLIGAKGKQGGLTPAERDEEREMPYDEGLAPTLKSNLTSNSAEFLTTFNFHEHFMRGGETILTHLLPRIVDDNQDSLAEIVDRMTEPVRTVAINCFYLGCDYETAARQLGTSIETIDFLAEVALDHVYQAIQVREPTRQAATPRRHAS